MCIRDSTYPSSRFKFGEFKYQFPSQFLNEIDGNYLRRNDEKIAPNKPYVNTYSQLKKTKENSPFYNDIQENENYSQIPRHEQNLKIGDRVSHEKFGMGKITSLDGTGQFAKATINFDNFGRKSLMLNFAKLEKM